VRKLDVAGARKVPQKPVRLSPNFQGQLGLPFTRREALQELACLQDGTRALCRHRHGKPPFNLVSLTAGGPQAGVDNSGVAEQTYGNDTV